MNPLALEWSKCPQGVVLREGHPGGRRFECRSDAKEDVRYELGNLEDTLVVRFLNATHPEVIARAQKRAGAGSVDAGFAEFFTRFGLPMPGIVAPYDDVLAQHEEITTLFWLAAADNCDDPTAAIDEFNKLISTWGGYSVFPTLRYGDRVGELPRLTYRVENLLAYLAMEIALIAEAGAKAKHCDQCFTVFLYGSKTGRRSHAEYCSDRCRVAAMRRKRKAMAGGKHVSS